MSEITLGRLQESSAHTSMAQHRFLFDEEAEAEQYWKNKEFKKFAVDAIARFGTKKQSVLRTYYARARDHAGAILAIKAQAYDIPARVRLVARLATPRELGCVANQ